MKFITGGTFGSNRYGALYRGTVGSSTSVGSHSFTKALAASGNDTLPADATAGEDFFFAMWENRSFGNDSADFNTYFTTGAGSAPHGNYVVIPWTYEPGR